ncbi:hypothetical protein B0H14DRAFT_2651873 [Mycena olivaceomarginata]|nr:hypothetical protein B0H14DRAFT_2651873 [Mycena olivaceomarginata]
MPLMPEQAVACREWQGKGAHYNVHQAWQARRHFVICTCGPARVHYNGTTGTVGGLASYMARSRYAARLAFDDALDEDQEPELLSTDDFDVALAYAEGELRGAAPQHRRYAATRTSQRAACAAPETPNAPPLKTRTPAPPPETPNAPPPETPNAPPPETPNALQRDTPDLPPPETRTPAPQTPNTPPPETRTPEDGTPTSRPCPPALSFRLRGIYTRRLRAPQYRKNKWLVAHKQKTAGAFYTKATKLYTLTPEEKKHRQDFHTKLRTRLGGWYRTQYANLLEEDKATFTDIFGRLGEGTRKPPRCPQLLHFYSEKRYQSHIKPHVEQRKNALKKRAEFTGGDPPATITIQNDVTKECWEEESEMFQQEMLREQEREHDIRLKAWRESNADGPNRTAEEFSASTGPSKSAAHYLQPFIDVIADRYGMCVSILMVGPIGEHGGRIEMRSVHSGKTRGLVEKDWPLHDPEGFTCVQTSMVDFGHHVFLQAERDTRITAVQEEYAPDGRVVSPTAGTTTVPTIPSVNLGGSNAGPASRAAPSGSAGDNVNELWQREDAEDWTEELTRAHRAFEHGRAGEWQWASLVDRFYNFEAAWGYTDTGGAITTTGRPKQWSIGLRERGKWEKTVDIGGAGGYQESWDICFALVQPTDRSDLAPLLRLHGKNGFLQVMVLLLWWGERGGRWESRGRIGVVNSGGGRGGNPAGVAPAQISSEKNAVEGSRGKKRKAADGETNEKERHGPSTRMVYSVIVGSQERNHVKVTSAVEPMWKWEMNGMEEKH